MKPLQLDKLSGLALNGDIELEAHIGSGGMGVVYRGLQKSLGRKVCVKFMQSSLVSSFEWQTRFRREAKALARLQHKHLAQVYSVGFYQNVYPFIVMELLSGVSLRQFIQESGRLEWRTAAEIMIQLCEGMSLVHDKGFVHRDLKPDNVFICQLDGKPCSKILDFGLVGRNKTGVDTETLTGTGDLLGTVLYMAPECFHKAQHNSAVDVYSLGCIFYEMLSGKPPFDGDSPVSIAMKHNSEAIPPLDVEYGSQEEQVYLYSLIAAICDKNPLRRPDCKHIEKSLREALNGNLTTECFSQLPEKKRVSVFRSGTVACSILIAASLVIAGLQAGMLPFLRSPSIRERLAFAVEQQKQDRYTESAILLREVLADPKILPVERLQTNRMLIETMLRRRESEKAGEALVNTLGLIDDLSRSVDAKLLDPEATTCMRLARTVLARVDLRQNFSKLSEVCSNILTRKNLSDPVVMELANLLAEMNSPTAFRVSSADPRSGISVTLPESLELAEALLKLSEVRTKWRSTYVSAAYRLIGMSSSREVRKAFMLNRIAISFLEMSEVAPGLEAGHQSLLNFDSVTSKKHADQYVIALLLSAGYCRSNPNKVASATTCLQQAGTIFERDARRLFPTLTTITTLLNLLLVLDKNYSSIPHFAKFVRQAAPLAIEHHKSTWFLEYDTVVKPAVVDAIATGDYTEAVHLAELSASALRVKGHALNSGHILITVANALFSKGYKGALRLEDTAINDLIHSKSEPLERLSVLIGAEGLSSRGNSEAYERLLRASRQICGAQSSMLNYARATLLHQQRRDFQAAELLFGATIGNMSPDLNAKIYQCFLTLDGGDKLKWVRQHRPYVLAELHKILAERTHAQVVDKYLVLASFAELLPDYRLQDNLLSLGALAKPSLGLLLQQYQCKMRLNDRVQARKIEPAIDRELKELVKKSPVEAKDNYTNYAMLLAKYGYSIEAMQKLMIAAELCRIHDRLAEENMLLSLISAATFRWWDVKDEIRKDPGYLQVMHRILALPPQDSSTWCRAVTWLEQVDKMAQNEPLAMQCALQIKPILSQTTTPAAFSKARYLQINGQYFEADRNYDRYFQDAAECWSKSPIQWFVMAYYCLNVLHTAQYQKGIATLKRLEPLVKEAPLLRDIQIQIAQFEYLIGNTAKAELIWAQLDRETFDKADLSECVRSRLMLYLLSGDKSRGNALCRKYSVCDTALGDAIELYKIGSDPRNVSSPERAARSYRDYLNSLPPERILYLEPYAIRLECGLAELFAGNLEGSQKQLSDLGGRIYPYNGNCLLEYDIEAAKLFLALRKNDLHSFSRILDRLKETAGSVSPLLTGNLLKTLACCEQQTSSNALRKQIREVITSLNQTR